MLPVTPCNNCRIAPSSPVVAPAENDGLTLLMPLLAQVTPSLPAAQPVTPLAEPEAVESVNDGAEDPAALLALLIDAAPSVVPASITLPGAVPGEQNEQDNAPLPAGSARRLSPALALASPAADDVQAAAPPGSVTNTGSVSRLTISHHAAAFAASQPVMQQKQVSADDAVTQPISQLATHATPLVPAMVMREISGSHRIAVINLPAAPGQQAEALQQALGERLQMQIDQRTQQATIRLDPPHLGKMDIALHYEAGKLQVQIQVAQPEVYRALQQVSADLRASLSEHNNVQVNVQVSTQSGDSRQQQRHQEEGQASIARHPEEVAEEERRTDRSILTTV